MTTLIGWIESQAVAEDVARLLAAVAESGREISQALRIEAAKGISAGTGSINVQGEEQKPLDIISNEILSAACEASGVVSAIVSEELEEIVVPSGAGGDARLALVFDPLDGSSNLEVNGGVGTIFSILDVGTPQAMETGRVLVPGHRQIAAGYILYGPATVLVLTAGADVAMFALEETSGTFVLTREKVSIPPQAGEFAINASRRDSWEEPTRAYIEACLAGKSGPFGRSYNMRWCAAMVADLHRILCRGGIFLYPVDTGTREKGGRLRLLYEASPMAMIVEAAGGAASDGTRRILDIEPGGLHQRVGVIIGSRDDVKRACSFY
ncbi:class 1 fructose-bisphosphatase [Pelagibacterium montanilacus]|uniref:class 1 fructose-bisphosphatase n=1 Tax=Pelagibacterium montanilacus TaxID=2185280 RepID=UPI000F8EAC11|nr:class 1 fructose-bisphosphatase [Pelagibacterium montanilacus]